MKFFIDTANLDQIREAYDMGVLDGVTTNPSLMAKEGIKGEAEENEAPDHSDKEPEETKAEEQEESEQGETEESEVE